VEFLSWHCLGYLADWVTRLRAVIVHNPHINIPPERSALFPDEAHLRLGDIESRSSRSRCHRQVDVQRVLSTAKALGPGVSVNICFSDDRSLNGRGTSVGVAVCRGLLRWLALVLILFKHVAGQHLRGYSACGLQVKELTACC